MRGRNLSTLFLGILLVAMMLSLGYEVGAKVSLGLSMYDVDVALERGESLSVPVIRIRNVGDEEFTAKIIVTLDQEKGPLLKGSQEEVLLAPDESFLLEVKIVARCPPGEYSFNVEIQAVSKAVGGNPINPAGSNKGIITVLGGEAPRTDSLVTIGIIGVVVAVCCTGIVVIKNREEGESLTSGFHRTYRSIRDKFENRRRKKEEAGDE